MANPSRGGVGPPKNAPFCIKLLLVLTFNMHTTKPVLTPEISPEVVFGTTREIFSQKERIH